MGVTITVHEAVVDVKDGFGNQVVFICDDCSPSINIFHVGDGGVELALDEYLALLSELTALGLRYKQWQLSSRGYGIGPKEKVNIIYADMPDI
jgi:hypothetical protein